MKTISSQFIIFLFYENILSIQKAPKCKTNNFQPLKSFCVRKIVAFVVFCLLVFVLLVGFGLICIFVSSKCFRKKIKWSEIVLITSSTIIFILASSA